MYKISIYGCAMFKKLVCQWVNSTAEEATLNVNAVMSESASLRHFEVKICASYSQSVKKIQTFICTSFIGRSPLCSRTSNTNTMLTAGRCSCHSWKERLQKIPPFCVVTSRSFAQANDQVLLHQKNLISH